MKLRITVEGQVFEVEVEATRPEEPAPGYYPPLHANIPAPASGGSPPPPRRPRGGDDPDVDDDKVCRSPLAGSVATINAQVGQDIQVDDQLLVLEAMKMETVITAPFQGKIKAIPVEVGDAVKQGQVLVEIE